MSAFFAVLSRFFCLFLKVTGANSGFPPPLPPKEEERLFKLARSGDPGARESLITHNLRLVSHMIKKYYPGAKDPEDLLSIGVIGLIKAIDTFDPAHGARFATYAGKCLQNEILMYFRASKKQSRETSLNEAIEYDRDGNALTYLDVISEDEDMTDLVDRKTRAKEAREAVETILSGREKQIVKLRYGLDGKRPFTQRETALALGISRSYVSRIEKAAIRKIRVFLDPESDWA